MKQYGEAEVKRLVKDYCEIYGETLPDISSSHWEMEFVTLKKNGDRAILTMNRPEDLNALNEEMIRQLDEKFSIAENDVAIKTIFITGTGKAFVAGADIKFFVDNIKRNSLDKIVEFTSYGQQVFEKIDKSKKNIVAVLNGMALGGGLELALCADVILAIPKATMAFPETGIGIYPGLGGTQRTIPRVGKGLAKFLILTGKMLSAKEANEIGLIDGIISIVDMFEILDGEKSIPEIEIKELSAKWKSYSDFFSKNRFAQIMSGNYFNDILEKEEIMQLVKIMGYKAPIAMQIADELIEQAKGPQSELEKLTTIFNTSDAMLGLSSIGKRVEYQGK
jgi:enoyl-CoA hydratase/3-hydroxyacyl-CoA dehydrogenase